MAYQAEKLAYFHYHEGNEDKAEAYQVEVCVKGKCPSLFRCYVTVLHSDYTVAAGGNVIVVSNYYDGGALFIYIPQ